MSKIQEINKFIIPSDTELNSIFRSTLEYITYKEVNNWKKYLRLNSKDLFSFNTIKLTINVMKFLYEGGRKDKISDKFSLTILSKETVFANIDRFYIKRKF